MIASSSARKAEAEGLAVGVGRRGAPLGRSRKDRPGGRAKLRATAVATEPSAVAERTPRGARAGERGARLVGRTPRPTERKPHSAERTPRTAERAPRVAERAPRTAERRPRVAKGAAAMRPARGRAKAAATLRDAAVRPVVRVSDEEVRTYLPLVRQVVQRMLPRKPPEVAIEDLMSWGVVGLLDAMRKYDSEREASFSTYAQYRIRGSILDYLRRCDWLPRSVRQRSHDVEAATTELEHRLGRPPTADEVAGAMGLSVEEYAQTVWSCGPVAVVPTADLCFGRGEEALSGDDVLTDAAESGPMSRLLRKERVEILARALEQLPEKERIVVSFYYFEGLTMREVAEALHLTEGRISQLHSQAMSRLRVALSELRADGDLID